ncbi:hypothetical protein VTO42DRAFT_5282 [Malbranchea cinnamomea]
MSNLVLLTADAGTQIMCCDRGKFPWFWGRLWIPKLQARGFKIAWGVELALDFNVHLAGEGEAQALLMFALFESAH